MCVTSRVDDKPVNGTHIAREGDSGRPQQERSAKPQEGGSAEAPEGGKRLVETVVVGSAV